MDYVILTMGRTGSSWFCDLLNSHPDITCHYEIFKDRSVDLDVIDQIKKPTQINIYKVLYYQLSLEQFKQLFARKQTKFIILSRNPIDRFVSYKLAVQTNLWHLDNMLDSQNLHQGTKDILAGKYQIREIINRFKDAIKSYYDKITYRPETIYIDSNELQQDFQYQRDQEDFFGQHISPINLTYHDLCSNNPNNLIAELFNVSIEELYSSRQKIDTLSQKERISNYAKLKLQLQTSPLAQYFRD